MRLTPSGGGVDMPVFEITNEHEASPCLLGDPGAENYQSDR